MLAALSPACGGSSQPGIPPSSGTSGGSGPTAPTSPVAPTGGVNGRVTERFPTDNTPIPGATVRIETGPKAGQTVTSEFDGKYALGDLPTGSVSLTASKAGFLSQTLSVDPTAGSTQLNFSLPPVQAVVNESFSYQFTSADTPAGRPVKTYQFPVHYAGSFEATLTWSTVAADLDMELWCAGTRLDNSDDANTTLEKVSSASTGAQVCEVRAIYHAGGILPLGFQLVVRRQS